LNKFIEIAAVVPWESGKRSLFSIFSMAVFQHLLAGLSLDLLHLALESILLSFHHHITSSRRRRRFAAVVERPRISSLTPNTLMKAHKT